MHAQAANQVVGSKPIARPLRPSHPRQGPANVENAQRFEFLKQSRVAYDLRLRDLGIEALRQELADLADKRGTGRLPRRGVLLTRRRMRESLGAALGSLKSGDLRYGGVSPRSRQPADFIERAGGRGRRSQQPLLVDSLRLLPDHLGQDRSRVVEQSHVGYQRGLARG